MKKGAVILGGGQSRRMGRDKASLPFGPESMLQRIVRLLSDVVSPEMIVVVLACDQPPIPLPPEIIIARDRIPGRGPMEGFYAGLTALADRADAIYFTSCDAPLLVPAFVTRLFDLLGDFEIAVPCDQELTHPLSAVYRPVVRQIVAELLAVNELRISAIFERAVVNKIPVDQFLDADPKLLTLLNVNCPEDYESALKISGSG